MIHNPPASPGENEKNASSPGEAGGARAYDPVFKGIFMKKNISKLQIIILAITVISGIAVCIRLPDTIAVQWNTDGANGFLSKYIAALISVGVCLLMIPGHRFFSQKYEMYIQNSTIMKLIHSICWIVFSCCGIVMNVLFLVLN